MQRLEIIGFIGQDAEVKDLGQNQVINFSVAVSETFMKGTEKTTVTYWFECAKWGNNTQIAQYLKKGTQVYISGKPQSRAWQKEDGSLQVVNGVNVFNIELLGKKETNSATTQGTTQTTTSQQPPAQNFTPQSTSEDEPDDLPF